MKATFLKAAAIILSSAIVFSACKKEKPAEPNDEEVITTMVVKLTPVGGGASIEYKFDDPDGPGGGAPTIQDIVLAPSTSYDAELILLNKTVSPVDTTSKEVEEEMEAHRFYFEPQAGVNLSITNLDTDANAVPVGLTSTWTTGAVSTGKLQITLRHYGATPPNKAVGDLVTSDKSSTDISTTDIGGFTVKVQ